MRKAKPDQSVGPTNLGDPADNFALSSLRFAIWRIESAV